MIDELDTKKIAELENKLKIVFKNKKLIKNKYFALLMIVKTPCIY